MRTDGVGYDEDKPVENVLTRERNGEREQWYDCRFMYIILK